jgi:hypothetical protein
MRLLLVTLQVAKAFQETPYRVSGMLVALFLVITLSMNADIQSDTVFYGCFFAAIILPLVAGSLLESKFGRKPKDRE